MVQLSDRSLGLLLNELLSDAAPDPGTVGRKDRKRRRRPHEVNRARRVMTITFPERTWPEQVRELARQWDVRPSDVVIYAFAWLMRGLDDGQIPVPAGRAGWGDRAGEPLDAPWQP